MLRAYITNFAALSAFSGLLFAATPLCDFGLCHETEAKPAAAEAAPACHGPAQSEPPPAMEHKGDCSHCSWLLAGQSGSGYPVFITEKWNLGQSTFVLESLSFQPNQLYSGRTGIPLGTGAPGQFPPAASLPVLHRAPLFELNAVWRI